MSGMAEVLAWHRLDAVTYLVSQEEYLCICGKRSDNHEEHQSRALSAAGFGPVAEAKAEALEEAADESGGIIAAGDIAECAAPVDGECGRYEAVAARDSLYEDGPAEWLRARAAAVRGEG